MKILEALDDKYQNTKESVEWVPLDFLKIILIQVREVRTRNVGVTATRGMDAPESWDQYDMEEPSQASLSIS